jgi:hypothetical protein
MSVTFFPRGYIDEIHVRNPGFMPLEPEDPVFNPRLQKQAVYPELNVSNSNAYWLLDFLGVKGDSCGYCGSVPLKELEVFLASINLMEIGVSNRFKELTEKQDHGYDRETQRKLLHYLEKLDIIVRTCIHFKTDLVWA